MKLTVNNIVYMLVILLVYFLVSMYLVSTGFPYEVLVLQIPILLIAVSPIGEAILRFIYGSKPIKTNRDKMRISGIYEEVYAMVKDKYPSVNKNITLYIDNSMMVNAYAIGRKSITVTEGALNAMDDNQLRGVLAHEFGHIIHGDTLIPLLVLVGNLMFLFFMGIVKVLQVMMYIAALFFNDKYGVAKAFNWLFKTAVNLIILLGGFIIQVLLMVNSRTNEYSADEFAGSLELNGG